MKKKKCICIMLALSLCMSTVVMADVEQDVIEAQNKYIEYQKGIDDMTAKVVKFNSDIESNIMQIETAENDLDTLNATIENNELRIETLEQNIEEAELLKAKRVREYYKSNGNLDYMSLLFDSDNFNNLLQRITIVTKLSKLDKEAIDSLSADKAELNAIVEEQEKNKASVEEVLKNLEISKKELEENKVEQEALLESLKLEQEQFGTEVLAVAESNLITPQIEVIENANSSIDSLQSAINQLRAIRDNQLTVESVKESVNEYIYKASDRIAELEAEIAYQEELDRQQALKDQAAANDAANNNSSSNAGNTNNNVSNNGNSGSTGSVSNESTSGSAVTGSAIVDYAYQFLGLPYVWGAVGPDEFDCSGFTSYVYRHAAGIEISRTTYTQINVGTPVSYSEMQPGDLVFTYNNEHVGIYVGGGQYINATYPGSTIRVTPVTDFYAARRVL